MANYYNAGRLISQEVQHIVTRRTLTGANQEDVWSGTATTRPSPGGAQLEVVSTSLQDDVGTTDTWTVTVGGGVTAKDVVQITIGGISYAYLVKVADTTSTVAEGLKNAITAGSIEAWRVSPIGTADAGDTWRTTINGVDYDFVAVGGETLALIALGIATAAAADPLYTATVDGNTVNFVAKAAGVKADVAVSMAVDANASGGVAAIQLVAGVAASTAATATRGGSVVTIKSVVDGAAGILVVSSSYTTDPGLDSTAVAAHSVTGAAGTGITGLLLTYLDTAGKFQSETVAMNGLVAVATVATDIKRLLSVTATSGVAAGVITIRGAGGGTEYDSIAVGDSQAYGGSCTVPSNRNGALVKALNVSASVASEVYLMSDASPATGAVVSGGAFKWAIIQAGPAQVTVDPSVALAQVPAGARVWLAAKGGAGRIITGSLDVVII